MAPPAQKATPPAATPPAPQPASADKPVQGDVKAEAKAQAQLDLSSTGAAQGTPPSGSGAADAKKAAPAEASQATPAAEPMDEYKPQEGFELSLRGMTAQVGAHYVTRNSSDFDATHTGGGFAVMAGPRGIWDNKHEVDLKLRFDWQKFSNDLGEGVTSEAKETGIGIQAAYAYLFNDIIGAGGYLNLGLSLYNAPEGPKNEYGFSDGSKGFVFNENAQLLPLDNETGIKVGFGIQVPVWHGIFRPALGYALNVGHNPEIDLVDGGKQRYPFSSHGFEGGLLIDGGSIYNLISGESDRRAAYYAKQKAASETPAATPAQAAVVTPPPPPPPPTPAEVAPAAPAAPAEEPKPTVASLKSDVEKHMGKAKSHYETVKNHLKNIPLQARMSGSDNDEQMKLLVVDAMNQAKQAQAAYDAAEVALAGMEALIANMESGEEKKAAEEDYKKLKAELRYDGNKGYNTLYENTREAYLDARRVHRHYRKYQESHDGVEAVEFDVPKPKNYNPNSTASAEPAKPAEPAQAEKKPAKPAEPAKPAKPKVSSDEDIW